MSRSLHRNGHKANVTLVDIASMGSGLVTVNVDMEKGIGGHKEYG